MLVPWGPKILVTSHFHFKIVSLNILWTDWKKWQQNCSGTQGWLQYTALYAVGIPRYWVNYPLASTVLQYRALEQFSRYGQLQVWIKVHMFKYIGLV